ncbi:MAG: hypothetical protein H6740_15180 [Alphaproteobacteria bacterium]|nr:hypothetical protein [Alphaproteobacteria bacterium]
MNPLIATVMAILANLLAGAIALRMSSTEARAVSAAGALVTLGAAGFCALPLLIHGDVVSLQAFGLSIHADALTGTLLLPLGLSVLAMALGLPHQYARPRAMAAFSFALAGTELALIADSLGLLLLAEAVTTLSVAWGLRQGAKGTRAARIYLGAAGFIALLGGALAAAGGALGGTLSASPAPSQAIGLVFLLAVVVRLGVLPLHSGLTAALSGIPGARTALLVVPMGGVLLLARVVQPALLASPWVQTTEMVLLGAALCAALMAVASTDLGRSAAWTVSALHALLVSGNLMTEHSGHLGGALLWAALILSETGFALSVILVTQRLGAVDLRRFHGLHGVAPRLSLAFLLVALSIAGVPGTLEFVAQDLLLTGASSHGVVGVALSVFTLAVVGVNALRVYLRVFYGPPALGEENMDARPWEQGVIVALVGLLIAGGVAPGLLPLVAHATEAVGGLP